jgi:hypothetical protein
MMRTTFVRLSTHPLIVLPPPAPRCARPTTAADARVAPVTITTITNAATGVLNLQRFLCTLSPSAHG